MSTIYKYQKHLEKYGPENLLLTAAQDPEITMGELADLKAQITFYSRNYYWRGGKWVEKRSAAVESTIRKCINPDCGLDIPQHRGAQAKYHNDACKHRHRRAIRNAERDERRRAKYAKQHPKG